MTTQEFIEKDYPYGCGEWMFKEALEGYAKAKCQELLEIVAEKAKITSENAGKINERLIIDKESILNCVDLENFCS